MSSNENNQNFFLHCYVCATARDYTNNVQCPSCGSGFVELFPYRINSIRPIELDRLMLHVPNQMNLEYPIEDQLHETHRRNIDELLAHFLSDDGRRELESEFDDFGTPEIDGTPIEGRLTEDQMLRLPSVVLTQNDLNKTPTCPICLMEYELNEKITELYCHHRYHASCINNWLKNSNSCPTCRSTVTFREEPLPSTSTYSGDSDSDHSQLQLFDLIHQRNQQMAGTSAVVRSSSNPQIEHPIVHPVIEPNPPDPMEIIDITSSDDEDEDSNSMSTSNNSETMDDSGCIHISSSEDNSSDEDIIIID